MQKEYGKNRWIKGFWLVLLFLFATPIANSDEIGGVKTVMVIIWLLILIKTIQVFMAKLIIKDDHITIQKGVIFREVKDIKYKKINSVDIAYVMGIGGIEIQIGNDKPIKFSNLEKYDEVKEHIHSKIDPQD